MATQTKSRVLFGREPDLEYLSGRVRTKGLTAITGRPQAGKTWLLLDLRDRLHLDNDYLVGYAVSTGQYADLLRRALLDLYQRWFSNASYLAHARKLWRDNKKGWITRLGKKLGPALGKLFETTFQAPGAGKAVEGLFDALHRADIDQRSGGMHLPTLDYDLAHDLLTALDLLTGGRKRAVLILDAFEQGEGARVEEGTLNSFVTNLDEWPESHILLALREPDAEEQETEALTVVRKLAKASARAQVWKLPDLHLEGDVAECDRLLFFLRDKVPAMKDVPDERILEMIGNHPGVIARWLEAQATPGKEPADEKDLSRVATDAFAYRYREVEELLGNLAANDQALLRFAIRLALAPEMSTASEYKPLAPILTDGMPASAVADLQSRGLLLEGNDNPDVPTYGHTKRYETARRLVCTDTRYRPFAREEAQRMTVGAASKIKSVEPEVLPHLWMLLGLGAAAPELGVPGAYLGLCAAGVSLLGERLASFASNAVRESVGLARDHPDVAVLVAMGLYNELKAAKDENHLARRDTLLDGLRELARAHPDDRAVGESTARGLFDTLNDAKDENHLPRRDALLDELRELGRAHADDAAIREWLAKGLFNTLNHAKRENDLARRDVLLDELLELPRARPDDAPVRKQAAMGLYNTLHHAKDENEPARRDELLDDLRELAAAHPDDAAVRERLGKGLCNTLIDAKAEKHPGRRDALLDELRELARTHPDDVTVRECLGTGLSHSAIDAVQEENPERFEELKGALIELLPKLGDSQMGQEVRELLEELGDGPGG